MMGLTALISVPLSVASAIYLEEYAEDGWFLQLVQINIANLAGVPVNTVRPRPVGDGTAPNSAVASRSLRSRA
jgi:hypothetical protein